MASDWIQSKDGAFRIQANELIKIIASHYEIWGLSSEELRQLTEHLNSFEAALTEQAEQAKVYHRAVADKQAKREELEHALRAMVRRINNHPGMTDTLREKMNLASPIRTPGQRTGRGKSENIKSAEKGTNHESQPSIYGTDFPGSG